jgi:hypothetical protein
MSFRCTHCTAKTISFLIHIEDLADPGRSGFSLTKAGQWPSIRPEIDRCLETALGEVSAGLYKKGLTAEAHNFGIGAFAYYRRVAESTTQKLLQNLRTYAQGNGATEVLAALDSVQNETQEAKRINAVKDLLPPALRPDGMNPLGTIYQALSGGLHEQSDEDCLEKAQGLRTALEFLVTTLETQKAGADRYVTAMRGLPKANSRKP